ncbi:hypothetical protein XENOCAPTIV_000644, partial [Xenoophorus captivus]
CNVQDYIWNKGLRCEWAVTEFQVLCVVVASTEPQTDGLSVSTTADGSQPNVRKLCDTPPPAPQAHTHNLAYYDNIICQVCLHSPPVGF